MKKQDILPLPYAYQRKVSGQPLESIGGDYRALLIFTVLAQDGPLSM
jgi:hypothetical protein